MSQYLRKSRSLPDIPGMVEGQKETFGGHVLCGRVTVTVKTSTDYFEQEFAQFIEDYGLRWSLVSRHCPIYNKRRMKWGGKQIADRQAKRVKWSYKVFSVSGPMELLERLKHLDCIKGDLERGEGSVGIIAQGSGEESRRIVKAGKALEHHALDGTPYPAAERKVIKPPVRVKSKAGKNANTVQLTRQHEENAAFQTYLHDVFINSENYAE